MRLKKVKPVKRVGGTFNIKELGRHLQALRQWLTALSLTKASSFVAIFALAGLVLWAVHAATGASVLSMLPQSGQLCGNASVVQDTSAIGGSALEFGASGSGSTPCNGSGSAPTDLQVFTGGNNIALVWDVPSVSVQSVQVWRDDQQIATVLPSSNVSIQNQQLGKEYDDNSVTAGSTYDYKVRAVLADGSTSDFTPVVTATQPTNSMPVPTITVNTTGVSAALANYVQTYIVPLLKTWYPKDADELAYPTYTPPTNLAINFNLTDGNYCETSASGNNSTISCDPSQVSAAMTQSSNGVAAAFVHESTHSIQDAAAGPQWTVEGGASWSSDFYARQNINNYRPRPGEQIAGYTPGAWFIEFMREKYNANFPRDLNIAIHNNTYSDSLFTKETGGKLTSEAAAWQAALDTYSAYDSSSGSVKGVGSECIVPADNPAVSLTNAALGSCGTGQQWALTYANSSKTGSFNITNVTANPTQAGGLCLDVYGYGKIDGSRVENYNCNGASNQEWTYNTANQNIVGVDSGMCLSTTGGSSASGTLLVIRACDGGTDQKWIVPG